jgi:hypothetical protein
VTPEEGVVIIVPVLGRPWRVQPTVTSIADATPKPYRVLFVATSGDGEEIHALKSCDADFVEIDKPGTYARKINLGARSSVEPLLFSAADDLHFHAGWLEAAKALLSDTVHVVGTNDLGNARTMRGEHSTHSLFTRHYIDTVGGVIDGPPGEVLHEGYPHSWVDDEFIQTAKARGVYAHAFDSHVEHLHWLWNKGEDDATYALGAKGHVPGMRLFRKRRRLWANL